MRGLILQTVVAVAAALASSPALALCGGGTVAQEFREADIVVRARLVSQLDAWDDEPSSAFRAEWGEPSTLHTLYGLRVLETYKGAPKGRLHIFEDHNSGAFYIDVDKDYLLFVKRIPKERGQPTHARGAFFVRYSCGQSKPMNEVTAKTLAEVRALAKRRISR